MVCDRWCVTKWCERWCGTEGQRRRRRHHGACQPFQGPNTAQHPKIQILVVLDRHLHRLLLLSPSLFRQHSRIKHQSIVPFHSHHNTPLHHPLFTDSALSSHTPLPDDSRMRRKLIRHGHTIIYANLFQLEAIPLLSVHSVTTKSLRP